MPAPDDGSAKYHAELIDRLFSAERDIGAATSQNG
jgi:hypothetical protein